MTGGLLCLDVLKTSKRERGGGESKFGLLCALASKQAAAAQKPG
jgi:hypothetical protein